MNHEEAIEAAHDAYYHGAGPSWEKGVDAAVRAYLSARAETDDDHREAGNPFRCEGCSADQLLADFGEER